MSRKHFQMLADHMIDTKDLYRNEAAWYTAICKLADRLADQNDNFDRAKFIAACKV